jgi:hypothetical protein
MQIKAIELRDRMTFIPAIAIKLDPGNEAEQALLARAGYGLDPSGQAKYVLFGRIDGGQFHCDPHEWGGRTWPVAHLWIQEHWDEFESGAVIDVQFILGETPVPVERELLG